jgi:hypothetical protein
MLGKIFGSIAGSGIVSAAEGIANIIDQFVETDDEKRIAEMIKAKMMMKPSLAQVELNKIEAGHRSIFVAGWRPFIGWVCGFALLWHFILFDFLTWITVNFFPHVTNIPQLTGTETLVTVLLSLLGLGAMRTAEKFGGKAK